VIIQLSVANFTVSDSAY